MPTNHAIDECVHGIKAYDPCDLCAAIAMPKIPYVETESFSDRASRPDVGMSGYLRKEDMPSKRYLPTDSAARKRIPMAAGLVDYFPDALAAIAEVSFEGNEKHNPGQPLHHARGKSMDHADCIVRHLVNRGGFDGKIRESAAMAWRALALLQEELETELGLTLPRGAQVD